MADKTPTVLRGSIVGEETLLTAVELCRACNASELEIELWVIEGVVQPSAGASREQWRFGAAALRRTRAAARLSRDLQLDAAGVALALDLLDRIAALESRLLRARTPADEGTSS